MNVNPLLLRLLGSAGAPLDPPLDLNAVVREVTAHLSRYKSRDLDAAVSAAAAEWHKAWLGGKLKRPNDAAAAATFIRVRAAQALRGTKPAGTEAALRRSRRPSSVSLARLQDLDAEDLNRVAIARSRMTPQTLEVLDLTMEGCGAEEIALMLGMTPSAVRNQLRQVRSHLAAGLQAPEPEE